MIGWTAQLRQLDRLCRRPAKLVFFLYVFLNLSFHNICRLLEQVQVALVLFSPIMKCTMKAICTWLSQREVSKCVDDLLMIINIYVLLGIRTRHSIFAGTSTRPLSPPISNIIKKGYETYSHIFLQQHIILKIRLSIQTPKGLVNFFTTY